jgi:predicted RNA binding protein YcfA (HicA-like mRNA interferase family)
MSGVLGFAVARIAGSHHVMRHPDGRGTTVPVHHGRDVAKGTLRGILSPEVRRCLT